jgi:uncharacterized protein (DUF4415 family)
MKKKIGDALTAAQIQELKALEQLPDSAIDTSDVPEVHDWSSAARGLFYRPTKQQLTLRLDADIIAWFRRHTAPRRGYQTQINRVLRGYVTEASQISTRLENPPTGTTVWDHFFPQVKTLGTPVNDDKVPQNPDIEEQLARAKLGREVIEPARLIG